MNLPKIRASFAAIAAAITYLVTPSASAAILARNDFESSYAEFVADIDGEDMSELTAYDSDQPSATAPYPFSGFGSKYLAVDTGDATIFREFATQTSSTYLDTFMQFEPTTGEISYTNVAKIVVYLDAAASNLCVISGTSADVRTPVTNRLISAGQVEPGTWGRLTINALKTSSDSVFSFNVRLNGTKLTNGTTDTFYSLTDSNAVSRVGFKGTGALDDLVARTSDPFGTAAKIGEETYGSLAQAGAEAVAGDTIILQNASSEDITLREAGVVFNTNGKSYTGHVSAASGLGWSEENGVYTASANTAATWTDAMGDHSWSNADNWSSHGVPTAATTVTLPDGATIEATGTAALPVDSLIVNGAAKLTCTGVLADNWPSIGIKGSVSGSGTLTLERFGLTSSEADDVTVGCNICFDGKTADSFLQSGTFVLNGSVTGANKFQLLANTTFNGAVTIPDGAILCIGRSGTVATATFGDGSSLSGDGTVALWSNGSDAGNAGFASLKTKLKTSSWTGVCELSGTMANIDFGYFGHSGSTVRANGLTGHLRFSQGSTTQIATGIKALDIGSSGFTMNNQFSSGSPCNYDFDAALTGAGTITFGTKHQNDNNAKSFYTFNGDVSEFTGIVQFGNQSYRPVVVFKASGDVVPEPTDWGQIMVTSNKTVNVCKAWNSVGGYWIRGTANVSSTGSLVCGGGTQKIAGDGVIRYAAIPTSDSSAELSSSGWTGTVELSARSGSGEVPLAKLGHSGSKIVINGITGSDYNSIYLSGGTEINAVVELKGQLKLTNGSTGNNYTFAEVTGSGNMFLSATGSPNTPTFTYTFTKLTNYGGEIDAVKTSDSKYAALAIGTVDVLEYVQGQRMVSLSENCNLTTDPDDIAVTINGIASALKLFKANDGNLYVKAASVTTQSGTTYYSTVLAAVEAAETTGGDITVLDGSTVDLGEYGYYYDEGTWKLGAAYVIHDGAGTVTTNVCATLAAAISASAAGDTVRLIQANDETGIDTTGKDFIFDENGKTFTGTVTGSGRITLAAAPSSTTWSSDRFVAEGWIGTVVLDYNPPGTPFNPNPYGTSSSYVELATGRSVSGYLNNHVTTKLRVNGSVTLNDGSSSIQRGFRTVSGNGTFIFQAHDGGYGETCNYAIDNLVDWNGTITVGSSKASITNIVSGSGSVVFNVAPTPVPTIGSDYTGEIELGFNWQNVDLSAYSGDNSTLVLGSMTGYFAENNGGATGIKGKTVINGTVSIINGWPKGAGNYWSDDRCVKFNTLEVAGSISLIYPTGTGWQNYWGYISAATLDGDSTGSITVGNNFLLKVNAVDFAAAPSGTGRLVSLALTGENDSEGYTHKGKLYGPNGVAGEAIPVTVGGVATEQKLVYATINDVSGLYLAVAQYAGNYYATFQDALNARTAAGGSGDIIALDASAPVPAGYKIADGKLVMILKPMVILF